jgi:hypothetical protein
MLLKITLKSLNDDNNFIETQINHCDTICSLKNKICQEHFIVDNIYNEYQQIIPQSYRIVRGMTFYFKDM